MAPTGENDPAYGNMTGSIFTIIRFDGKADIALMGGNLINFYWHDTVEKNCLEYDLFYKDHDEDIFYRQTKDKDKKSYKMIKKERNQLLKTKKREVANYQTKLYTKKIW